MANGRKLESKSRSTWFRNTAIASAALFTLASVVLTYPYWPRSMPVLTDADQIRMEEGRATIREVLWTPPVRMAPLPASAVDDYEPRVSQDGLSLFFVRGRAGENADIFMSRRVADGWSDPEPLADVNSPSDELGPAPSPDGDSLYFYSNREGGLGGYDLWVARRRLDGSGFGAPVNLGSAVNSPYNDYGPSPTPDGERLYFSTNRPRESEIVDEPVDPWAATIRESRRVHDYDLYVAAGKNGEWQRAARDEVLSSAADDGAPAVSPIGDFVYFASDREGGAGGFDLYRARLRQGIPGEVEQIGDGVNTPANELDPALDMGGFGLYFSSDRERSESDRSLYRLYHTVSREVYRDVDLMDRAFDWALFWDKIGVNLLLALLTLLLMLLLLYLMQSVRGRRLSLLARCLLASLLAHLLLLFALTMWRVSAGAARAADGRSGVHVTLASRTADSVAGQILGAAAESPAVERVATPSSPLAIPVNRTSFEMPTVDPGSMPQTRLVRASIHRDTLSDLLEPTEKSLRPSMLQDVSASGFASIELSVPRSEAAEAVTESSFEPAAIAAHSRRARVNAESRVSIDQPSFDLALPTAERPRASESLARLETPASDLPAAPEGEDRPYAILAAPLPAAADVSIEAISIPSSAADAMSGEEVVEERSSPNVEPSQPSSQRQHGVTPAVAALDVEVQAPVAEASPTLDAMDRSLASSALPEVDGEDEFVKSQVQLTAALPVGTGPEMEFALPSSEGTEAYRDPATERGMERPMPEEVASFEGERVASAWRAASLDAAWSASEVDLTTEVGPTGLASIRNPAEIPEPSALEWSDASEHTDRPAAMPNSGLANESPLDLALPATLPPVEAFAQRDGESRARKVEEGGGSEETEDAVLAALKWLAEHQSKTGRWDARDFDAECRGCGGETENEVDVGVSGLALLAFLAAGHTSHEPGPFRDNVDRGIEYLLNVQRRDGDLRGRETMYSHAMATMALAEAYGMTRDERLREPVERAVRFIDKARNRAVGGWRYDPGQPGDTSVTGWQIMALKSAAAAGLDVPFESVRATRDWLDLVSSGSHGGAYAYMPGREPTRTMTAEGLFVQLLLGGRPDDPRTRESVDILMRNLPDWDEAPATYYWYYGTLAMFQHGGEAWNRWNKAVVEALVSNQRRHGSAKGSWDPSDPWSEVGGRVYQTAICALTLEVYYRYLPAFAEPVAPNAIGTITGVIRDNATGEPLAGASVKLDIAGKEPLTVDADDTGRYVMHPPEVPTFFALSAMAPGYLPASENVASAMVTGKTLRVDFALEADSDAAVALELEPVVHHLGDDAFDGLINSRFQRESEGDRYKGDFLLSSRQLHNGVRRAELSMMVKGVQLTHRLYVNGTLLDTRLEESPRDGRFGEFTVAVPLDSLRAGENAFEIRAGRRGSDVDDFEFVNIQLRLLTASD